VSSADALGTHEEARPLATLCARNRRGPGAQSVVTCQDQRLPTGRAAGARHASAIVIRSYSFTCISFLTEVTPLTARATRVALAMSSRELTKPLN
jgi:hypothetical protein